MNNTFVRALALLMLLALFSANTRAQYEPPLTGLMLAVESAEQDRMALYDVERDFWRVLTWREHPAAPYGAWVRLWGFSPDGCRLLLTMSDGAAPADLYTARVDGGDLTAPIRYDGLPNGSWGVWEPQWSPDGSKIAMTLIRQQTGADGAAVYEYRIGWIDADASHRSAAPRLISVSGDEHTPRWSPDGAQLAYVSYEQRVPGADIFSTAAPTPQGAALPTIREADIWIVGADNPDATKFRLTNFPIGNVTMPRWSPDGDLIGFVFSPAPNQDYFWMIGAARGAAPTQLSGYPAVALDLTWLPDGSGMVAAARGFAGEAQNRLWKIPLTGAADAPGFLEEDAAAYPNTDYPRYSPDGRWLAFRSAYTLMLMDRETGQARRLDAPGGVSLGNTPPVWGEISPAC